MDLKTTFVCLCLAAVAYGRMQDPYIHDLPEDQLAMESGSQGRAIRPDSGSFVRRLLPGRQTAADRTPAARVPLRRRPQDDAVVVDAMGFSTKDGLDSTSISAEDTDPSSGRPWWQRYHTPILVLQPILMPLPRTKGRTTDETEYYGAAASPEAVGQLGVQALRRRLPFDIKHLNQILRNMYYY